MSAAHLHATRHGSDLIGSSAASESDEARACHPYASVEGEPRTPAGRMALAYLQDMHRILAQVDICAIERIAGRLEAARDRGAMIYVAGNGGSAATASHWTNDLGKAAKRSGCTPFRIISLADNVPWLTALANDEGYECVFAGQLENFARRGDVLVVISASGNSLNVLRAVELARTRGLVTVGFVGFDGGRLRDLVDECLWISTPPGAYGPVEDGHAVVCHLLTTYLAHDQAPHEVSRPSG